MTPHSIRYSAYLLRSGRVIFRCKKNAISARNQRIATGIRPDQLPTVKRLFLPTTDAGHCAMEALGFIRDRITPPLSAHKIMVKLYRSRVKAVLNGEVNGQVIASWWHDEAGNI